MLQIVPNGKVPAKSAGTAIIMAEFTRNSITYSANCTITVTDRIAGDVSGDGKVDSADLLIMQNMMLGNTEFNKYADFDGNGVFNTVDLLLVQLCLLGY